MPQESDCLPEGGSGVSVGTAAAPLVLFQWGIARYSLVIINSDDVLDGLTCCNRIASTKPAGLLACSHRLRRIQSSPAVNVYGRISGCQDRTPHQHCPRCRTPPSRQSPYAQGPAAGGRSQSTANLTGVHPSPASLPRRNPCCRKEDRCREALASNCGPHRTKRAHAPPLRLRD